MPRALQKETHSEKGKESGEIDKMERMLYDAAFEGNVSLLLALLREDPLILHGFQLCEGNFTGSPLHLAAKLGYAEFAAEILNRKPELAEELV
ncbi:hypothetical protein Nepgr_000987 [Nepenthes gracilis]|uniref:Uncharacterized protein n=1 Tax=Nepenthes gracilis TaxID=150966 RepID=A0AAD3RX98_NEPGR|nr:hypothetical protein Nepgr_000987 [Nepenthes gracilis]